MPEPLRLAVIGLGRMGAVHALHAARLAEETGRCRLSALVDADLTRAQASASELAKGTEDAVFGGVSELLESGLADAAVVATPTGLHREHSEALIEGGLRVMLEKPMTESVEGDREFVAKLNRDAPNALMLAFQRRFDPPLKEAKELLDSGAIGRPFKIVSVLEDSGPLPDGYSSVGLFQDVSVHNVDEVLWLSGGTPARACSIGSRLYSDGLTTANEDFDDGFMQIGFEQGLIAQICVSRNHVPGYRIETWIYGEEGMIHVGRFEQNRSEVVLQAFGRDEPIVRKKFSMPSYDASLPEFVDRFGLAYKAELEHFVDCCLDGGSFEVNQNDALRAMEVIAKAAASPLA